MAHARNPVMNRKLRRAIKTIFDTCSDNFRDAPGDLASGKALLSAMAAVMAHYLPYWADQAYEADTREYEMWTNFDKFEGGD